MIALMCFILAVLASPFKSALCFVIVRLDRREMVWINVTQNPTAEWIARQLTEAFPWHEAPRYLVRDHDRIYGDIVLRRIRAIGIRDRLSHLQFFIKTSRRLSHMYMEACVRALVSRDSDRAPGAGAHAPDQGQLSAYARQPVNRFAKGLSGLVSILVSLNGSCLHLRLREWPA